MALGEWLGCRREVRKPDRGCTQSAAPVITINEASGLYAKLRRPNHLKSFEGRKVPTIAEVLGAWEGGISSTLQSLASSLPNHIAGLGIRRQALTRVRSSGLVAAGLVVGLSSLC